MIGESEEFALPLWDWSSVSKCGPQNSNISIPEELVSNADSRTPSQTY